jgi:aminoglycoside/choline kinase family phosphotransferase
VSTDLFDIFSQALKAAGYATELERVTALVPEASARRYFRLHLSDGQTIVGVSEEPASAAVNMPNVLAVQKFLTAGNVAVPQIFYTDIAAGIMLQQDLGDMSLNQLLKNEPDKADLYYQDAILHMLQWQRLTNDGKCPAFGLSFDVTKLMFEFDFFIDHTLRGYYRTMAPETELKVIRKAFLQIAEELAAPTHKVFNHRDYHSRNIQLVGASTPLSHLGVTQYIIDFQDARLGLMQYDLCSLLCDAYAPLTVERRSRLLDFAFEQGKDVHRQSREEFDHYFALSAFQRIVKAMGTFGRQAALGREDFAAYLQPAWQTLSEVVIDDARLGNLVQTLFRVCES